MPKICKQDCLFRLHYRFTMEESSEFFKYPANLRNLSLLFSVHVYTCIYCNLYENNIDFVFIEIMDTL